MRTTLSLMASEQVHLSIGGRPKVVLPAPDPRLLARIEAASPNGLAVILSEHPDLPEAWARLGAICEPGRFKSTLVAMEAYAYYRVGYHRGLDALRKNGWRGTQLVRWSDESNRGFLRCLDGLRRMAGWIGEADEESRCAEFLLQLDPDWPLVDGSTL
ncbi:MAG: DUF3151 family protein [bacterium]|nr:DUF3151 family protein [bacterium]MDE0438105.1 DUF3151 family protein [bacterium]